MLYIQGEEELGQKVDDISLSRKLGIRNLMEEDSSAAEDCELRSEDLRKDSGPKDRSIQKSRKQDRAPESDHGLSTSELRMEEDLTEISRTMD